MRYAALNQGLDTLSDFGGFVPALAAHGKKELPDPKSLFRYSDAQLYALARFLYVLTPPPNPHESTALSERGREVFEAQKCNMCHAVPAVGIESKTSSDKLKGPDLGGKIEVEFET